MPKHDAQTLINEVKENGARDSVLRLRRDGGEWKQVIARIATGRGEWIDLAIRLKPGADAVEGRELQDAMFRALNRSPSLVLERAQPEYPLAALCQGPVALSHGYRETLAELDRAQDALQRVLSERLRAKREFCLATLAQARADLQRARD